MSKFELSINVKYLPEWGVWEGVRELIQNGKDAEVEFNAPLTVDWKNGTLRIENEGAVMNREALLFGTTRKGGRADLIGKFGEGLKLGVLALVRAGRPVTIRSGSEVWDPTIARSEKYDAEVLMFDIKGNRKEEKRVRVEIGGVIESEWNIFRSRFLFLKDKRESDKETVKTEKGSLLLHKKYAGKVYSKGIFVMNDVKMTYGYDLPNIELDRDRKMVNHTDLTTSTARVWSEAAVTRPDLFDAYFDMTCSFDAPNDVVATDYWNNDIETVKKVAARWLRRHGDNAVPVLSTQESAEVEHYGCKGIVVPKQLRDLIGSTVGTVDRVKERFQKAVEKVYSVNELTCEEIAVYAQAWKLLWVALWGRIAKDTVQTESEEEACTRLGRRISVVDFKVKTLNGLYTGRGYEDADATIQIARHQLNDVATMLGTLIHEFSHDCGYDGSKNHVASIEDYWERVVRFQMKGSVSGSVSERLTTKMNLITGDSFDRDDEEGTHVIRR